MQNALLIPAYCGYPGVTYSPLDEVRIKLKRSALLEHASNLGEQVSNVILLGTVRFGEGEIRAGINAAAAKLKSQYVFKNIREQYPGI